MNAKAPSILSSDLSVKGSIASEGEVQLDGSVEGDVRAASLTIGEDAAINGEVIAEHVVIRGRVNGSVRARQVQLASTARVEGDIIHATLAIESGAFFDGNCKRSSDPIADSGKGASASKPAAPAASTKPAAPPAASSASTGSAKAADPFAAKS
ncbi:MAG: polymer-forming cytoskeletal protein [Pseudomonadota bacterium]